MALADELVTVGTTPTLLANPGVNRADTDILWVEVHNATGVTIYVGGPSVDTTSGRPVVDGASWSAALGRGDAVYAVVASGTEDVHVLKSRQ
jgi:hypothetical protein